MPRTATLTFSIEVEGDVIERNDDAIKEFLLEILADQSDSVLLSMIEIGDSDG